MPEWIVNGSVMTNYLRSCKDCDINTFKRHPHLTAIWEHCPESVAMAYYEEIKKGTSWLLSQKITNDFKGNPIMLDVGYSASTLQYMGVMSRLIKLFGSLDDTRILEFGGGYGGQARVIMDVFDDVEYHIVDLPEVCHLVNRYIPEVHTHTQMPDMHADIFISNYALSEIRDNDEIINNISADHGYITCNMDTVNLPWDHKRMADISGERDTNYILYW